MSISVLPLLLLFGGFSLPLGLPPLPEDPAISRAAPEECLAYVSWAGTATPEGKSTNQTEQLLAEPEVQKLLSAIDNALATGIKKNARPGTGDDVVAKDIYPLVKTLLMRPAAVFLSKVTLGAQGFQFHGGAIVNLGEKTVPVSESLARLERLLRSGPAENGALQKVEIAGKSFHRMVANPWLVVTWGIRDKYLIVGFGPSGVEGILERATAQPPTWMAAIRKQLPVDRQSSTIYLNVKQTVTQFAPLGGTKVKLILDAFGLGNVNYLASVTGLDSKGTATRTLVAIDGEPQGIFQLAAAKPLVAADLSSIPRDATIAAAGRLDAHAALELLLTQAEKIEPMGREEATRGIAEMEKELGIDLKQDLLKPLGDVWCVYNSPAEGGLLVTGLTGVVQVKDHDRLQSTLSKLIALFHDRVEGLAHKLDKDFAEEGFSRRHTPRIVKTAFAGQVIYHFDVPEGDFPFAPAFCLTKKELIFSTFPQNIKSYLSRGKDFQSLAVMPDVARALEEGDAMALSYCDTRKMAEFVYPLLCIGGKFISSELNREGIPLDASLVPSATAIFPHLHSSIGLVRRTSTGIEIVSRGPLAGVGGGPLLPLSFFWLSLARVEARSAPMSMGTRAVPTMNNLKIIALAALNYLSTHGTLPPAYISDKATGKPLLSWRVALLPFLEQESLYREFHVDEPWNSEHNKTLIARMPTVYRSGGGAFKPGKTRYVTLRHKDSAFPGKDGVRPAEITHGMSNTILAVECDEAHAVIWTKPDDLEFDPKKPESGLTGQPARGFNAAFCDGSVKFIQDSIDSEFLQDMANRTGGRPAKQ